MSISVLAFVEQRDGDLRKTAGEVVSAARRLYPDGTVTALLLGEGAQALAAGLGRFGAANVLVCESTELTDYRGDNYAAAVLHAVDRVKPGVVLFAASNTGKDLAPRVAARLGTSAAMDCVELKTEDGKVLARRPIFAGKAFVWVESSAPVFVATLRPNVFPAEESGGASQVEVLEFIPAPEDLRVTVKEKIKTQAERPELTESDIIVSGGRGMKGPENFKIIEELADTLHAAVGASRAAVDAGWREHSDQVGQTGKTVSPTLYIACGISGAIQHLAGMSSSKVIVAINKDPEAPIFNVADYGIVGDLFEVVPALTEEIKKNR